MHRSAHTPDEASEGLMPRPSAWTPERRAEASAAAKLRAADPELRRRISEATKAGMSRPEVREKLVAPGVRERRRSAMSRPEVRLKISIATKAGMMRAMVAECEFQLLRAAWTSASSSARQRFIDEIITPGGL